MIEKEVTRHEKYPDVLENTQAFESDESTDWDKAYAHAELLIQRGYILSPEIDVYDLAKQIQKKYETDRNRIAEAEKAKEVWKD